MYKIGDVVKYEWTISDFTTQKSDIVVQYQDRPGIIIDKSSPIVLGYENYAIYKILFGHEIVYLPENLFLPMGDCESIKSFIDNNVHYKFLFDFKTIAQALLSQRCIVVTIGAHIEYYKKYILKEKRHVVVDIFDLDKIRGYYIDTPIYWTEETLKTAHNILKRV